MSYRMVVSSFVYKSGKGKYSTQWCFQQVIRIFTPMKLLRFLAFPFSLLYGCVLWLRNKFYDWNILKSTSFDIPVICVGNLSVGGTGKTPHIEYLIPLLSPQFKVAVLSRGYGRKTKGFLLSDINSTAADIGDEPLQFKTKFPELHIAVDEKRVRGIQNLLQLFPDIQVILLDDAFQHRAVKADFSIVLTDFSKPYFKDYVVPTGTLREFRMGIKRAQSIVVTKCPDVLVPIEKSVFQKAIQPKTNQQLHFSYIKYGEFVPFNKQIISPFGKEYYFEHHYSIVLFTGIANTQPLEYYLKEKTKNLVPVRFADHHAFTLTDIENIKKIFDNIASANKILLTTEKDVMRLKTPELSDALKHLPLFYIPIEIAFHKEDANSGSTNFNKQLLDYVTTIQRNSSIHSK